MKQFTEQEIMHQMKCNHCTREEALDILAWDYDIDHGDKEKGAMTAEQKKMVRSLTKADRAPDKKNATAKRERKVDENKKVIFDWVRIMLEGMQANGEIENLACMNEGQIDFMRAGEEFTIKFTKHRAKKA